MSVLYSGEGSGGGEAGPPVVRRGSLGQIGRHEQVRIVQPWGRVRSSSTTGIQAVLGEAAHFEISTHTIAHLSPANCRIPPILLAVSAKYKTSSADRTRPRTLLSR